MSEGEFSGIEDRSMSAADIMKAKDSHGMIEARYRPMRGQAYIEMTEEKSETIILPEANREDTKSHRGIVLALGPPARLTDHPDSAQVPWGFDVGDEVIFVLAVWMDRMRILGMRGKRVAVVAQGEICGVIDRAAQCSHGVDIDRACAPCGAAFDRPGTRTEPRSWAR